MKQILTTLFILWSLFGCSIFQPSKYFVEGCLKICRENVGTDLIVFSDTEKIYECQCNLKECNE
jgi:hypothetical protein